MTNFEKNSMGNKESSELLAWLFADLDTIIDCYSGSNEEDEEE